MVLTRHYVFRTPVIPRVTEAGYRKIDLALSFYLRTKIPLVSKSLPTLSLYSIKGCYYDHFWIHQSKWSFWYQMKAHIFLITSVKFYAQQMLLVKVISENVAKVR